MGINNSVFASNSERRNFYALEHTWGKEYKLYHNLPFLNILNPTNLIDSSDISNPIEIVIDDADKNRLKKTSIDYTLCDINDHPILGIDFDGLQNGFNVGDVYYTGKNPAESSPWRRQINELKLKVARGSFFPYFIVGYKQFSEISKESKLTIVDGIIGEVISLAKTKNEIDNFSLEELAVSEEEFNSLPPSQQHALIQDWVIGVEVINDMENNPVIRRRAQLEKELEICGYASTPLNYPPFEPGDLKGFLGIIMHGHRITYDTKDLGKIEGEAWIPHFNMPGFSGYGITEDIAAIYALENIKWLRKNQALH